MQGKGRGRQNKEGNCEGCGVSMQDFFFFSVVDGLCMETDGGGWDE